MDRQWINSNLIANYDIKAEESHCAPKKWFKSSELLQEKQLLRQVVYRSYRWWEMCQRQQTRSVQDLDIS